MRTGTVSLVEVLMNLPVTFNRAKREQLRQAYENAVSKQLESFTFDGREYLTAYAKYVLQYLDEVL
jgi:hypothetical protein